MSDTQQKGGGFRRLPIARRKPAIVFSVIVLVLILALLFARFFL